MNNINQETILYLLALFFGLYISLQIYIILKLKKIIVHLFEILFQVHDVLNKLPKAPGKKTIKVKKYCQNCKYRLPFYNKSDTSSSLFYYNCQITRKKVPPDYYCSNFVFDQKTLDV